VVDVADGANVYVGFGALKFLLAIIMSPPLFQARNPGSAASNITTPPLRIVASTLKFPAI
jgi:hypothetical protein